MNEAPRATDQISEWCRRRIAHLEREVREYKKLSISYMCAAQVASKRRDTVLDAAELVVKQWDLWKGFAGVSDEGLEFESAVNELEKTLKLRGKT